MAKPVTLFNVSTGKLILPNGQEIAPGGEVEITKDLAENAGVKSWIADGLLGNALPAKQSADLAAENARLTSENEAQAAQILQLTADLEAATKPKE